MSSTMSSNFTAIGRFPRLFSPDTGTHRRTLVWPTTCDLQSMASVHAFIIVPEIIRRFAKDLQMLAALPLARVHYCLPKRTRVHLR